MTAGSGAFTPEGGDASDVYEDPMAYVGELFTNGRPMGTRAKLAPDARIVVKAGSFHLPSGRIRVTCPTEVDSGALERTVPGGSYRSERATMGGTVGFRILFSDETTTTMRHVSKYRLGTEYAALVVADATALTSLLARPEGRDGPLAINVGTAELLKSGVDGGFRVIWGLDRRDRPTSLVVDLWWDPTRPTRTFEFATSHPPEKELRRYDVGVHYDDGHLWLTWKSVNPTWIQVPNGVGLIRHIQGEVESWGVPTAPGCSVTLSCRGRIQSP
jgi:hypothetical protein